jgi:phenylalanyl-tRNA synthetase beta subunit
LEKNDVKKTYKQSQYQTVKRDITFRVSAELEYAKLANLICKTLAEQKLWFECEPISIWQGDDKSTKNISFNLTFASYEKTLTGPEIAEIVDEITNTAAKQLNATVI